MDGLVFRQDDPIWNTHYPPNGWRCRCRVRALTESQVRARGIQVRSSEGHLRQVDQVAGRDKRTGQPVVQPGTAYDFVDDRGKPWTLTPDAGWSYNPGRRDLNRDAQARLNEKVAAAPPDLQSAAAAPSPDDDPFAIPDFLQRTPGDRPADLDAPGAGRAGTDRPPVTYSTFRRRRDYRPAEDLPGRATDYYSEDWYREMNSALRNGRTLDADQMQINNDMVSAMRETTEDVQVWRGRRSRIDHKVDDEFTDEAFSSWSEGWHTAQRFAWSRDSAGERIPGTIYKVRLPKGTRAVVENETEQEVLLRPGAKFRVAEIVENAEIGADPLYRGPSRVYILEVVKDGEE